MPINLPPVGCYVATNSGASWEPASAPAGGEAQDDMALNFCPPPVAMHCYDESSDKWVPVENYGGDGGTGTVTSITADPPLTGGVITKAGHIGGPTLVTASNPGKGIAHFAGGTQVATSSLVSADDLESLISRGNIIMDFSSGYIGAPEIDGGIFYGDGSSLTNIRPSSIQTGTAIGIGSGGTGSIIAPVAGQIPIAQSGVTYTPKAIGGDSILYQTGIMTNTRLNGGAVPVSASYVGTNGSGQLVAATLPSQAVVNISAAGGVSGGTITNGALMVGTPVNAVRFSVIPQTYNNLTLVMQAGGSASSPQDVYLRFNSDTGANYTREWLDATGTTPTAGSEISGSSVAIVNIPGINAVAQSNSARIYIDGYSGTTFKKNAVSKNASAATSGSRITETSFLWNNTAAITQIDLLLAAGNFVTGSRFMLYGMV